MASFVSLVGYLVAFTVIAASFLLITLLIGKLVRPNLPNPEKDAIYECGEPTIGSSWVQFDLRFYVVALLFVIFDVEVAFFFPWAAVFGKTTRVADTSTTMVDAKKPLQELGFELDRQIHLTIAPERELGSTVRPLTTEEAKTFDLPLDDGVVVDTIIDKSVLTSANIEVGDVIRQVNGKAIRSQQEFAESLSVGESAQSFQLLVRSKVERTQSAAAMLGRIAFVDLLVFFGVVLVGFAYLWKRGDLDWVRASTSEAETVSPARWTESSDEAAESPPAETATV